jgi:hypothetical protein
MSQVKKRFKFFFLFQEIRKHLKIKRPYDMSDNRQLQSEEETKPETSKQKCRCKK